MHSATLRNTYQAISWRLFSGQMSNPKAKRAPFDWPLSSRSRFAILSREKPGQPSVSVEGKHGVDRGLQFGVADHRGGSVSGGCSFAGERLLDAAISYCLLGAKKQDRGRRRGAGCFHSRFAASPFAFDGPRNARLAGPHRMESGAGPEEAKAARPAG